MQTTFIQPAQVLNSRPQTVGRGMGKYRLTLLFAVTAVLVIAAAALIANHVIGSLAEDNLVRIAEENTARDGLHIQSMMRTRHSMEGMSAAGTMNLGSGIQEMQQTMPLAEAMTDSGGMQGMQPPTAQDMMPSAGAMADSSGMQGMQPPMPLTLETLAGPTGLTTTIPMLTEGFNIVKFEIYDRNGMTLWSSDQQNIGISIRENPSYQKAAAGRVGSELVKDADVIDLGGVSRRIDVVNSYLPLPETPGGKIVGVMEVTRDVSSDVALQVDDAKSVVLRTTIGTMGGLFAVLLVFIVVADMSIYRSRRREVLLVEGQLEERRRAEETLRDVNENLESEIVERERYAIERKQLVLELENKNRELEQESLAKTQILSTASHELKTPLTSTQST